jgi:coenzyme PQQ synthesis protein D (PqqD)
VLLGVEREDEPLEMVRRGLVAKMTDSNFPPDNGTWEPDPEVVAQRVEGETVLVHLRTNEIYALNSTGSRAWDLLTTGMDRKAVHEELQREFDAPGDQIRDELDALIANLIEKKLLRPSAA